MPFLSVFASLQLLVLFAVIGVVLALSVWSLIDTLLTPARAFTLEGKQSKTLWLALNALACVLCFIALPPLYAISLTFVLFILVIPGVYLVSVRPAVLSWRRRKKNPPASRGPRDW